MTENLKIVIAMVLLFGIVVNFLDRWYASPRALLLQSSPNRPWWLAWLVWVLTSVPAILYVLLDLESRAACT
jgi:hypothetical protein